MFKRKFEISVQQPINVCEERVLSLEKGGLLGFLAIDVETTAIEDNSRKIRATQRTGGFTPINMEITIAEVKKDISSVSGIAELHTFGFQLEAEWLLICLVLATILAFEDARLFIQIDGVLILAFVWLMAWRLFVRNHLINTLDHTLNPGKKKKRSRQKSAT